MTVVTFYEWFLSHFAHNHIYYFLKISTHLFAMLSVCLNSIVRKYISRTSLHMPTNGQF
ncbi:hypothetical protein CORMATOL_01512 [Corynebacterium matruchotii ATCC 33806]|uniref:Uncharacterized protein n=1 Tax=Corynebacterium matruchotii ATCC 33806 TaxID=566549 RepID=C0E3E9_9CORY|nr:hypothetical protein CORMATOL_01512 [Corynebacterium matruchotii ATCC 33806]